MFWCEQKKSIYETENISSHRIVRRWTQIKAFGRSWFNFTFILSDCFSAEYIERKFSKLCFCNFVICFYDFMLICDHENFPRNLYQIFLGVFLRRSIHEYINRLGHIIVFAKLSNYIDKNANDYILSRGCRQEWVGKVGDRSLNMNKEKVIPRFPFQ